MRSRASRALSISSMGILSRLLSTRFIRWSEKPKPVGYRHGTPLECIDERRLFLLRLHCSAVRRLAYRNCVGVVDLNSVPCPVG